MYREVFDDGAQARFLETITGAVGGVKDAGHQGTRDRRTGPTSTPDLGAKLRANLGTGSGGDSASEAAIKF